MGSRFSYEESDTSATVLAVIWWHLWEARNEARNNNVVLQRQCVATKVLSYMETILTYIFYGKSGQEQCEAKECALLGSATSRYDLHQNVDAAPFPDEQRMEWVVIFLMIMLALCSSVTAKA
jgi:hypothetical protein